VQLKADCTAAATAAVAAGIDAARTHLRDPAVRQLLHAQLPLSREQLKAAWSPVATAALDARLAVIRGWEPGAALLNDSLKQVSQASYLPHIMYYILPCTRLWWIQSCSKCK
jgi:hypothetical protein